VLALGVPPGPEVGRIVRAVYEQQLDGLVSTVEEARAEAARLLGSTQRSAISSQPEPHDPDPS
jgi:hypothetical protein